MDHISIIMLLVLSVITITTSGSMPWPEDGNELITERGGLATVTFASPVSRVISNPVKSTTTIVPTLTMPTKSTTMWKSSTTEIATSKPPTISSAPFSTKKTKWINRRAHSRPTLTKPPTSFTKSRSTWDWADIINKFTPGPAFVYTPSPEPVVPFSELNAGAPPENAGKNNSGLNPTSSQFVRKPTYRTFSNFDFQSLNLVKHQEDIELDLFNYAIALWSGTHAFEQAGITADEVHLLRFFGQQEESHSYLVGNMMGQDLAPEPCNYTYPFCREPTRKCVRQFLQFSQVLTRWGESGVYGFLPQMDNAAVAELLLNSISTEARQQYSFRQLLGLFPVPVHFIAGIPQSWAWTLLSQYITTCPKKNFRHPVEWSIWPPLRCSNPDVVNLDLYPSISNNVSALTGPGRKIALHWAESGSIVGPYKQKAVYGRNAGPHKGAKLMIVSQLNTTYVALKDLDWEKRSAYGIQPEEQTIFPVVGQPVINGTIFAAVVAEDTPFLTPANLSLIVSEGWMVAGPCIYQSG